jgi:hypothetical protein
VTPTLVRRVDMPFDTRLADLPFVRLDRHQQGPGIGRPRRYAIDAASCSTLVQTGV